MEHLTYTFYIIKNDVYHTSKCTPIYVILSVINFQQFPKCKNNKKKFTITIYTRYYNIRISPPLRATYEQYSS